VSLLRRPDKVQSREAFHAYVEGMLRSLNEALARPAIPYGPAVDGQGQEWENPTLEMFLEAMDAWMTDTGWTVHDRRESLVWTALSVPDGAYSGDEDDLRRYLADLRDWASDPALPEDQHWAPAALALRAGQGYE
jgi:hypothetical protein